MSRKSFGILGAVAVTAAAFAFPALAAPASDPGDQPYTPFKIGDGLYYVGSSDYTSYLIVTKAGLIVIDGGDAATGHQVVGNIRTLGFDPTQVKVLVNTHQHFDHSGGIRAYVAAGIPIVTHEKNKPYWERILKNAFTLEPDRLARASRSPVIETVGEKRVMSDSSMAL